jgi:hypothetical protein
MTVWQFMALHLVTTGQWRHLSIRQFGWLKEMGMI